MELGIVLGHVMLEEERNVLGPLAQRRQDDGNDLEPVVEVFAKVSMTALHPRLDDDYYFASAFAGGLEQFSGKLRRGSFGEDPDHLAVTSRCNLSRRLIKKIILN